MANTVLQSTQFDGGRKLINTCQIHCGTGGEASNVTLVDVSTLNSNAQGAACLSVSLNKIWYTIAGATVAPGILKWQITNATTGVKFLTLAYDNMLDFSTIGGLVNNQLAVAGAEGDVIFHLSTQTTQHSEYTVWCEWIKNY
jgi:hypothetical protein|tara:strand:+ start:1035 stop:1460 length:426 start_codon:yes stop_codon:yes gene_type:complete